MKVVSVLVPCYNTAPYIAEAIRSVFAQTHKQWELIIADDGSTDDTADVVESLIAGQPVTLLKLPHGGCAAALKAALDAATGDVVTFLGSDDTLMSNSLSVGVPPFQDTSVGYVWTAWKFMGTDRHGWSKPLPPGTTLWSAICNCGWWGAGCQQFWSLDFYRKSRGLDTSISSAVDYQIAVLLGETGCATKHVPVVTYVYRHPRPGSMSTSGRAKQKACDKLIRQRSLEYMRGKA